MKPQVPMAQFQQYLDTGRFMLQRGSASGRYFFYPRTVEPVTGSDDWEWVEASGLGTVYSTTVIRQKPPAPDYNLALVDLDEGPRLLSRIEDIAPEAVTIGMRVRSAIVCDGDQSVLVFKPEAAV